MAAMIQLEDLEKTYQIGETPQPALRGVSLAIERGEFVAIMGPSGSGKSTLMNIIGCLDRPSRGRYRLDGVAVDALSRDELAAIRGERIGFVFQNFNLLPRLTIAENVALPTLYTALPARAVAERVASVLAAVGLAGREAHRPNQLSGGQQQRVAIARALVNQPELLLADEPTGALDSQTSLEIMAIFQNLNRQQGITVVLVTHEADIAQFARRIVRFVDGRVVSDELVAKPVDARLLLREGALRPQLHKLEPVQPEVRA